MPMICPMCGKTLKEDEIFCPECGTSGEIEDQSKKGRKTILPEKINNFLNKEFKDVYSIGFKNVNKIDLYDDKTTFTDDIFSRWIKESTCLVLKDGRAFISVEMMANFHTSPIVLSGNVLVHSIADSAVVKFKGRREPDDYILDDDSFPRFLLIVLPDPSEDLDSSKELQIKIIEHRIKELEFLDRSTLKDFTICLASEFEKSFEELISNGV